MRSYYLPNYFPDLHDMVLNIPPQILDTSRQRNIWQQSEVIQWGVVLDGGTRRLNEDTRNHFRHKFEKETKTRKGRGQVSICQSILVHFIKGFNTVVPFSLTIPILIFFSLFHAVRKKFMSGSWVIEQEVVPTIHPGSVQEPSTSLSILQYHRECLIFSFLVHLLKWVIYHLSFWNGISFSNWS